ncbi:MULTISPECIES: hypothetical protein [Nocardioides]|uniref:Collagen triple helix repeat-containing protein n=1 Tax=Nocardioides lianchengensis TaxID=1045774 RepID=A0A1G6TU66_9ACTN|nr:hypothetical protein [Nocardioides lianchengensis]NYG11661.1 hypothetical protein [Nocardioides lianchengensis]SDD31865.1 hypothetical protein SAMN05421872_107173 [Nocardioides lianchengensis]
MRRPTPSLIVSVLALVVATGGTSYAAVQLTGKDIKNGSIYSADIADQSLRARDFRDGVLKPGPKGDRGPAGEKGDAGPAGTGRWALVAADGTIEAQSGGFTVASAYDAPGAPAGAVGNVYIDANEDLSDNAVIATIALQNQVDQNGDTITNGRSLNPDANPEFSGEITATQCAIAGVVACAPTGTNTAEHLVVSPRLSDGQVTTAPNRKRFYVVVTGDSTDYVAPAA